MKMVISFILATLTATTTGAALSGTEIGLAAGAAGATLVGPAVVQALTKSEIEVTVEAAEGSIKLEGALSLQRAISAAKTEERLTAQKAILISDDLYPKIAEFERLQGRFKVFAERLYRLAAKSEAYRAVADNMRSKGERAGALARLIQDYRQAVETAVADNALSASEAEQLSVLLAKLRSRLRNVTTAPATADYFSARLASIMAIANLPALKANPEGTAALGIDPVLKIATEISEALSPASVANALKDEQTKKQFYADLKELLFTFGFQIEDPAQLQGQTQMQIYKVLTTSSADIELKSQAADSLAITFSYTGVPVGSNFGPLLNEAFQTLFSTSEGIDTVLTNKWHLCNFASSKSHAGDHNAIIYFDNTLTPILKNATFDPSQFIAANAQLYKRALSSLTDVLGVPTSGTDASSGLGSLNTFNLSARAANATSSATADRDTILKKLNGLLDLAKQIQNESDASGAWKTPANATTQTKSFLDKLSSLRD
jgi:hypothetical protein